MKKPLDIFITSYLRQAYTQKTIEYLEQRTKYPYRLFVIDNGGNEEVLDEAVKQNKVFLVIRPSSNMGIHAAWNIALSMAESDYFITSDNDIYVPDLRRFYTIPYVYKQDIKNDADTEQSCWLERMVNFMDDRPDYGAISLCPHIFIGAAGIEPNDPEDVKERNMCGAVMRIMRRDAVWKAGGWEKCIRTGRNHEERTICSRLQTEGYKTGIATRIRAYHPFKTIDDEPGSSWGYPPEFPPEKQGHNPELAEYVKSFDNPEAYDSKTWLPKT